MTATTKSASSKGAPKRPSSTRLDGDKPHSDKRDAIVAAALECFVERGFHGTAVPEIADRAGVGAGTIYRYFESKEALVNAIYRAEKTRFADQVIKDLKAVGPARELFRSLWMKMAEFAVANPKSFVFMELHHHAEYLDEANRVLEQRMLELFSNVVTAAQQRGELKRGSARLLMGLVMGAFVGMIRNCVEIQQPLRDADFGFAEQCMWEAIRA